MMTDALYRLTSRVNARAARHAWLPIPSPITLLGFAVSSISRKGRITTIAHAPEVTSW